MDSDNYFARENDDFKNIDIYYRIAESEFYTVDDVRIAITIEDATTAATNALPGEKNADGSFKRGDNLHVVWPDVRKADGTFHDAGYYRAQLKIDGKLADGTPFDVRTPIADALPNIDGWQCPNEGLAIHDLVWKHRPIVHTTTAVRDHPMDPAVFRNGSGLFVKNGGADVAVNVPPPAVTPDNLLNNDTVEHFLDRNNYGVIDHGLPAEQDQGDDDEVETTLMHTVNREDHPNFAFLQYWLFFDASMSAISGADPYHEGDVEFVQAAIRLNLNTWMAGSEYTANEHIRVTEGDSTKYYRAEQDHTADANNQPPNQQYWSPATHYKAWWFRPFSATAAQHYYGQTVRWNVTNGAAAAGPQQQTWVQHVNNERFRIFVAEGTHATYFAAGQYAMGVTTANTTLGSQMQYANPAFVVFTETAGNTLIPIDIWQYPAKDFENWNGLWGYKNTDQGAIFRMTDQNGPHGPVRRFQVRPDGTHMQIRNNPVEFNNRCRRPADGFLEIQ